MCDELEIESESSQYIHDVLNMKGVRNFNIFNLLFIDYKVSTKWL